jgi:hypothetical protein
MIFFIERKFGLQAYVLNVKPESFIFHEKQHWPRPKNLSPLKLFFSHLHLLGEPMAVEQLENRTNLW